MSKEVNKLVVTNGYKLLLSKITSKKLTVNGLEVFTKEAVIFNVRRKLTPYKLLIFLSLVHHLERLKNIHMPKIVRGSNTRLKSGAGNGQIVA